MRLTHSIEAPALHDTAVVRFLILVFGFALGVASTLIYAAFANPSQAPAPTPLEANPQLSVTIGEPLLAELVKRAIAEAPGVGAKPTIQVSLRDDAIAVDASVDVLGRRARGTALLRPTVVNGKLKIAIASTSLGALQIPALESVIEKQLDARIGSLAPTLAGLQVTVTGARVDRTGLTLTCRVDLAALKS